MRDLFFFKRKKLFEMDEKLERVLQAVEDQSHTFHDLSDRLDSLEQAELRSTERIDHVLETMMNLNRDSRQYVCDLLNEKEEQILLKHKQMIEELKNILKEHKESSISLTERSIEEIEKFETIYKDNEKEVKEYLNVMKEFEDVLAEAEKSTDEKLDVIEKEIRLLLVNSVMEQMPEET